MLGEKQNVAFDDLAKLHQLGLVICHFKCFLSKNLKINCYSVVHKIFIYPRGEFFCAFYVSPFTFLSVSCVPKCSSCLVNALYLLVPA